MARNPETKALDKANVTDNSERNAQQSAGSTRDLFGCEAARHLSSPPTEAFDQRAMQTAFAPGNNGQENEFRNVVKDNNGNLLLQVRQRVGNTNEFKMSEYEGVGKNQRLVRTEQELDVRRRPDGQIEYRQKPEGAANVMVDLMLGESWLVAGDLPSAKERFLEVAGDRLFKGHGGRQEAEKYINMLVNRNHQRAKDGFKAATDDQLAAALRHLTSIYETERTGSAAKLSLAQVDSRVESALKSLGNPEKYNNQGQVGSCYLNSCLFIAEMLHPDKVAKTFAQVMTKGAWRKHAYSTADLSAQNGRDSFNNMMTNALASTFGFNHIGRNFRGTTEPEAQHAYKALTGSGLPLGRNALKNLGMRIAYTYGMAHAQVDFLKKVNGKVITDRENWWNGYAEG